MWKTNSCLKCGGDVFLDIDEDIWFDHCLQCGYMRINQDLTCPQCDCNMLIDIDKDGISQFYHCSQCGYIVESYDTVN